MKKKLLFIINPFSGIGQKKVIPTALESGLDKEKFDWKIKYTERAKHAVALSAEAAKNGFDAVIAVGGDGSINEVARSLIHTNTALGIIPGGSGNGVARSLGIPLQVAKAVALINRYRKVKIDTGLLHEHPFVGVAGIGFDAEISKAFAERKIRGPLSYGYLIISKMNNVQAMKIKIKGEWKLKSKKAIVLAFANTKQYGNNAYIAPTADPTDGKMKLSIIEQFKAWQLPHIAQKFFTKKIHESSKVTYHEFEEIKVKHNSQYAHLDGEPIEVPPKLTVKVVPHSLWVICGLD